MIERPADRTNKLPKEKEAQTTKAAKQRGQGKQPVVKKDEPILSNGFDDELANFRKVSYFVCFAVTFLTDIKPANPKGVSVRLRLDLGVLKHVILICLIKPPYQHTASKADNLQLSRQDMNLSCLVCLVANFD